MPLVTVDALKNSLTHDQKKPLVEKITSALVEIGSENTPRRPGSGSTNLRAETGRSAGDVCQRTT